MGMDGVEIRPRRLAHVNLYVGELERSISFYERVAGIELVRREPGILGGFHSNGNTHHDIGLIEISRGKDRVGRDGKVQIAATRGTAVGLNHLGWEMENEAELVAAYHRLQEAGVPIFRSFDHLISHSLYLADPDGNVHEFYADAVPDWRQIFNLEHEDLVTSNWDPLAATPNAIANYPVDPAIREVAAAPLHPRNITGVTIATHRFDAMKQFFMGIGGLSLESGTQNGERRATLSGSIGQPDLTLCEVSADEPVGLRLCSFLLTDNNDIELAITRLKELGLPSPRLTEEGTRRVVRVKDPDGFEMEFYRATAS
jgi:catechol 2,3-dioxygenase